MLRKFVVEFGTLGAILLTAGCLGLVYDDEAGPPQQFAEPEAFDQPEMLDQHAYRPIPRPKPRPALPANTARNTAGAGKDASAKKAPKTEVASTEPSTKPPSNSTGMKPPDTKSSVTKAAEAGPLNETKAPASKTAVAGPVTPAEIRTAVPVQNLDNPKLALSGVQVKSVWGGVLGRVASLDVSSGKLKTLDISVSAAPGGKPKVVRVESSRLKYMPNRKMVLTTLSKPDLEKLPATANP